jgi:hypothetical protein
MQASDSLVGKHQDFSRFSGQGLRHQRVAGEWLKGQGIKAVIPPKSNRKEAIDCDYWHYKERHAVECLFGKLKHYRRIAMRYEKKAMCTWGCYHFPRRFYG